MSCKDCKHGYVPTYDLRRKGWLFCSNKASKWYIRKTEGILVYVKKDFNCNKEE